MEDTTALAELLLSEPEIVAWLELDDDGYDEPVPEPDELALAS